MITHKHMNNNWNFSAADRRSVNLYLVKMMFFLTCLVTFFSFINMSYANEVVVNPYAKWENGPPKEADYFPIGVWLQNTSKAVKYKEAGINTYVGLWDGPIEKQLTELKKVDMKAICQQNEFSLKHMNDPTIIGWMHGDEPDIARSLGEGKGYGPPIQPKKIIDDYNNIYSADPTRPVFLNLSMGVAWDDWPGRGVRTSHPEDYPEYIKGCDIVSFDIYPVTNLRAEVAGNIWFIARGVERLREWSEGKKTVWNCIECTRINNPKIKPSPQQVRAEVWMSIVHGSMGIIYFVHEWQPRFRESALLSDPEMLSVVTQINQQITELAPVLNTPTLTNVVSISPENEDIPIAIMAKEYLAHIYIFAVSMREGNTKATLTLFNLEAEKTVQVIGENRIIISKNGLFEDKFDSWEVHLYRISK